MRTFKSVDTCAAEFEAATPYYYSGWERRPDGAAHEVERGDAPVVVILGAGPNRIGQGIEFDYCCVHAAMTVRESGRDAVMINCNPETVSTDYDTSDRLYFEPLTLEDVLGVIEVEQPEGVIVQFGGQTPLKLAHGLADAGRAAARHAGRLDRPGRGPRRASAACSPSSACAARRTRTAAVARRGARGRRRRRLPAAGAPVLRARRPGDGDLLLARAARRLPRAHAAASAGRTQIFLDRFLENAIEIDVDALCDGEDVQIGGIMQHVEEAGVHSGDSACVIPAMSLGPDMLAPGRGGHRARSRWRLGVIGLINIQFAVAGDDELYVIEANPRASRTVPFVSKAIGVPLAKIACRLMLGERLADMAMQLAEAAASTCR